MAGLRGAVHVPSAIRPPAAMADAQAAEAGGAAAATVRPAVRGDAAVILRFIIELAEFEKVRAACQACAHRLPKGLYTAAAAATAVSADMHRVAGRFARACHRRCACCTFH